MFTIVFPLQPAGVWMDGVHLHLCTAYEAVALLIVLLGPPLTDRTTNERRLHAVRLAQETLDIFLALQHAVQSNGFSIFLPTALAVFFGGTNKQGFRIHVSHDVKSPDSQRSSSGASSKPRASPADSIPITSGALGLHHAIPARLLRRSLRDADCPCMGRTDMFGASRGPMPSADGLASVTGMAKPCQSRIRGWHGLFSASRGPSPSADGPGHPRIIHLRQNRLPCIAKTAS